MRVYHLCVNIASCTSFCVYCRISCDSALLSRDSLSLHLMIQHVCVSAHIFADDFYSMLNHSWTLCVYLNVWPYAFFKGLIELKLRCEYGWCVRCALCVATLIRLFFDFALSSPLFGKHHLFEPPFEFLLCTNFHNHHQRPHSLHARIKCVRIFSFEIIWNEPKKERELYVYGNAAMYPILLSSKYICCYMHAFDLHFFFFRSSLCYHRCAFIVHCCLDLKSEQRERRIFLLP